MFGFKDSASEHNDIWLQVNIDVGVSFLDWSNSNVKEGAVGEVLIGSALTQKGLGFCKQYCCRC